MPQRQIAGTSGGSVGIAQIGRVGQGRQHVTRRPVDDAPQAIGRALQSIAIARRLHALQLARHWPEETRHLNGLADLAHRLGRLEHLDECRQVLRGVACLFGCRAESSDATAELHESHDVIDREACLRLPESRQSSPFGLRPVDDIGLALPRDAAT